jgi:hypothetical protein
VLIVDRVTAEVIVLIVDCWIEDVCSRSVSLC